MNEFEMNKGWQRGCRSLALYDSYFCNRCELDGWCIRAVHNEEKAGRAKSTPRQSNAKCSSPLLGHFVSTTPSFALLVMPE